MSLYVWPIMFAIFVWWFTTGAALYVIGLPRRRLPVTLALAAAVFLVSLAGLYWVRDDASITATYWSFMLAILAWGANEIAFLTGAITGPRTQPCPKGLTGLARTWAATETVIYHELALFLSLIAIAMAVGDGANQAGLWTFALLWIMRLSAKLNLFLGVPNLAEEFLPAHLSYLASYFRRRPMNALFPLSITLASAGAALLAGAALDPQTSDAEATALTFQATMLSLAVIEHWFMVIDIPQTALWGWGLSSRESETTDTITTTAPHGLKGDAKPSCPASLTA